MPELQVKKVVAVCFLESAKLCLEHLGAHRLSLSQEGHPGPAELPRLYGDVRRLRDYLQRSVSGYQDIVVLDLSDADAALLVACCRRLVEAIDHRLEGPVPEDERQWLIKKRQVLSDWAVEMAAKPLLELPLSRLATVSSEAVRALTSRLQGKVFGDVASRQQFRAPQPSQHSTSRGIATFAEQVASNRTIVDAYVLPPEQTPPEAVPIAPAAEKRATLPPLLDHHKVQDPRLRSLISVDMNALDRCCQEGDHRLATVMLASVMESALLDHAMTRRSELGLTGSPDTWKIQDLLIGAMTDAAQPKDRALSFHLFASRNLLRPALQMITPTVVTAASFEALHEFVARALYALGFGAPAKASSSDSVSIDEFLP